MNRAAPAAAILAALLLSGCPDDPDPVPDAGVDSGVDSGTDAGTDAGVDAGTCRSLERPPLVPRPPTDGLLPDELYPPCVPAG